MTNKQFWIGVALAIFFVLGLHLHGWAEPSFESYSEARSVRVCAFVDGQLAKCGTGIFTGRNSVTTALHVVSPIHIENPDENNDIGLDAVPDIMILRDTEENFEPAVLRASYTAVDLAVLTVKGVAPQAILRDVFWRGEDVLAIGNPMGHDFVAVKTKVVGIIPFQRADGSGTMYLISVDSKGGKITHGFSGGGLFTAQGMIGMIQMCEPESETCWALPTAVIENEVKGLNQRVK